jgi:uncharacterized protein (TIGR03435 family)
MVAALGGAGLAMMLSCVAFGQSTSPPAFEVADVKVSKALGREQGKPRMLPGGRLEFPNVTLKLLITAAYNAHGNMIMGSPGWLDSDRFDIVAKAAPGTSDDQLRQMLQTLLVERFKLAIHREEKPMSVYALIVGKRGATLPPAAGSGESNCSWHEPSPGRVQRECHHMTMAELALQLPGWGRARVDLPVVDLTGLQGAYDFQLEWSFPNAVGGDAGRGGEMKTNADSGGATVFDAVQKFGLKLESRRLPMPMIFIDHVERVPTEN